MTDLPKYVEVETSRFCNRICAWCPNSVFQDRRTQELMPWKHLEAAAASLARHGYNGWFAFHNYNEPLANPRIFDELEFISANLPKAATAIYTNGDRLTETSFRRLVEARLRQMRITIYPKSAGATPTGHRRLWTWLDRRPYLKCLDWQEARAKTSPALRHNGRLEIVLIDPIVNAYYDRGGTIPWLSIADRKSPCFLTSHSLSVDYAGDIKMCCNVVSGNDDHRQYILGNIGDTDLVELWNSPRFVALREQHRAADWSSSPICATCRQEIALDQ